MVDQVRALLRQPEVVVGTWRATWAEVPDLTEAETRAALERLNPLWRPLRKPPARVVETWMRLANGLGWCF